MESSTSTLDSPSPAASSQDAKHASSASSDVRGADQKTLSAAPIVRSKRTPIACTECRRRQVKCTGTTPQCERCSKRGIKCEYIPCSQQKAASSSPPLRPAYPEHAVRPSMPPYQSSPSLHRANASWQQGFYPDGSNPYHHQPQPNDWPSHSYGTMSESQVQSHSFSGVPAHPRAVRTHYGGDDHGQTAFAYQSYGDTSTAQSGFSSHNGYPGGPIPSAYPTSDMDMGSGDLSLSYVYSADHGRAASQARIPSQHSAYPGQYAQGGNNIYNTAATTVLPDASSQGWSSDVSYTAYPSHLPYC